MFRLSHALVENSKEQWKQTEEACTHPARARGADKYAGTSLTPGVPGKIRALSLSPSLVSPSLFLSLSYVRISHWYSVIFSSLTSARLPSLFLSQQNETEQKATQTLCVWIWSRAWVVRNGKRTFAFLMDGWKDCMKLKSGVCFWQEKDGWYFKTYMAYKYQFDNARTTASIHADFHFHVFAYRLPMR